MGFFDDLVKNAALLGAVEASKDKNGKPDPYKAAGIAAGMGNFSFNDRARLGAMLGSQGAFDTNTGDYGSNNSGYGGTDDSWKLFCEDGFEHGIDPDDYDSEEEYEEALAEAKYGWRDECEDGFEHGIDPDDYETEEEYEEALSEAKESEENTEITLSFSVNCLALDKLKEIQREDYPNQRRYNAAYKLADEFCTYASEEYEQKVKERCRFILENADKIIAANYLSHNNGFLYAQAIKDHFELPCSLPEEDETREMEFSEIMVKIARYDIPLSLEIWSWCLQQFLPYGQYDDYAGNDLSGEVIGRCCSFPDGYKIELIHYMENNPEFFQNIMSAGDELSSGMSELIVTAIREKRHNIAENLFKKEMDKADGQWKRINTLIEGVIMDCKNYEEDESMKCFRDTLLPFVKMIDIGMVQDEIPEWEKEIAEYIGYVESRYEYKARAVKAREERQQQQDKRLQEQITRQAQIRDLLDDKSIYTYCGVLLPFSDRVFSFRTEDDTIQIGDTVIVPVGKDNEEMEGKVVSVGQYARVGVPYPVEKTKFILKKG